jgi:rfaE bifunctional protein nucleotidyltransferase chain/domain
MSEAKVVRFEQLESWRAAQKLVRRRVVVTNGCFDLLHRGHVEYLQGARELGDVLLVGVNGDAAVRELKGEGRPIHPELDRALVLAALECVTAVCVFPGTRATEFLERARPTCWVKGGDYTVQGLDALEREVVHRHQGEIVLLPLVPGRSTTGIVRRLAEGRVRD